MKIPETLEECYKVLDELNPEDFQEWLRLNEKEAIAISHHGLGTWVRNNWGLWSGKSELFKWFKYNKIDHPDDMSSIILTSYHRYKNNKDIKLQEQFAKYIEFWLTDKEKEQWLRKKKLKKLDE